MVTFLYLVARDKIKLKANEYIDLHKLYAVLKNSKDFWVNGDPSMEIETFNKLTVSFPQGNFLISYKGQIFFHKINSLDFFLNFNSFKKKFVKNFVSFAIKGSNMR